MFPCFKDSEQTDFLNYEMTFLSILVSSTLSLRPQGIGVSIKQFVSLQEKNFKLNMLFNKFYLFFLIGELLESRKNFREVIERFTSRKFFLLSGS